MFAVKFYVVSVGKENPSDKNHQVRLRMFRGDASIPTTAEGLPVIGLVTGAIVDFTVQCPDAEIGSWKDVVGKFSAELLFEFPA